MNTITNGNGYPVFEPDRVPIFEPNQVLKNTDLNSIVTYLDSHNRLTRTHLIGMGIVCGLDVKTSSTLDEIRITAGCGITSEGFFVQYLPLFDTANVDQYRFTHYRDQSLNKNRLIPSQSADEQYSIKELVTAEKANKNLGDSQIHPLLALDNLAQQVVLILCDWEDLTRDSCLIDCDDRGQDRNFRLRFFLIDKSGVSSNPLSAERLLRAGFDIEAGQSLPSAFQGWFNVPDCSINRLGYLTQSDHQVVDLSEILSFDDLIKAYYQVCKAGILSIDTALRQTHILFGPFVSTFRPSSAPFATLKNRLRDILIGLVPLAIANADRFPGDTTLYVSTQPQVGYGIQYFYDYLVELIAAFNELKDALFDLMDVCMPDMAKFPKYLLAGEVILPTAECPRPSLYRHSFYQPPIYNGNQQRKQEIHHLYKRLERMSEGFNLLPFYQTPVKITPSRTRQALLGEQAIPYYYSYVNIYPYWNYEACRKQRENKLPAYFRLNGLPNQRGYDLIPRIDWADFLRIEGHAGLPLSEAIQKIEQYKSDFNLAFDLVVVRLGTGKEDPDLLKGYFDDLEVEFDQIKADWQQKYNQAKQTIQDENILDVLSKIDEYFFRYPDLAKIDAGLLKNDFHKKAKNPDNYQFRALNPSASNPTAYQLVLNLETEPPYRVALVTRPGGQLQTERIQTFTFADETHRVQDQLHVRRIFAANFEEETDALGVEIDAAGNFRFVLSSGSENIELVGGDDLPELLIRLEDETPFNRRFLVDRYHDFEALFTFLKFFGAGSLTPEDAAILVSYYEFRALFRRYLLRLESVKKLQLFQEYAKQNRGLEHLGGVPIGGTFVLVYTSDETVVDSLITSDSVLTSLSDQKVNQIKAKAQLPSGELGMSERGKTISSDRIGQNVVVADFCLPYLCCSAYISLNYVMAPPKPFIALPQAVYCEGDDKVYDFILDPPGGLLRGGDGIVNNSGNYAFQPSTVDADVTEPMNLTFFYIVDGVGSSFSVLMLPIAEVSLSIRDGSEIYCVNSAEPQLINFEATPPGGRFQLSVNEAPYEDIAVDQNSFDLATIPIPEDQKSLTVRFTYTMPSADDYCGNTSEPVEIILVRRPRAQIDYDQNEDQEARGILVYGLGNCSDLRRQVEFRNGGSEAEVYQWLLNGTEITNSRNATIEIPYTVSKQATVKLIASNQHTETDFICSDPDEVTVILPQLDASWKFDSQPESSEIIVLCRDDSRDIYQESLTVNQPGGVFSSNPPGRSRFRRLSVVPSDASLPCEEQRSYILDFADTNSGTYTLTYALPDGSQFSRQVAITVVPVGSFTLNVKQLDGGSEFEISFANINPSPGNKLGLRYQWEIRIGERDPIVIENPSIVLPYDGERDIRGNEPISVLMRLTSASGLCESVSEPQTAIVPVILL